MGQRQTNKLERRRYSNSGFSLIELLVVVAVILIIAAIAIPNYVQSRMRANEASAAQSLRIIATAEMVYSTTYAIGYSTTLTQLAGTTATPDQNDAELVDAVLAGGVKQGYLITYTPLTTDSNSHVLTFSITADPLTPTSGQVHFYSDQTCVIRSNVSVQAGPTDNPL